MKTITATIDRESAAALQALLNQDIVLFAPHADMEYGSSVIAAKHVSVALTGADRFVVLECDWEDTAAGYDYYRLRARLADRPRGIAKLGRDWNYLSFSLGASQPVAAVEVLEERFAGEEEAVRFDAGLRITRQDGTRIAIVRRQSIAGLLEFSALPEDNDCLASDLQTRLLYGALP